MQVDVVTLGPGLLWQSSSDDLGAKWLLELLCRSFFKFAHRFHFEHCLFKRPRHMHSFQKAYQLQCLCVCCGNPSVNRAEVVVANSRLVYREHRASKQVSVLQLQLPLKHNDVSGFVWKLQLCSTCRLHCASAEKEHCQWAKQNVKWVIWKQGGGVRATPRICSIETFPRFLEKLTTEIGSRHLAFVSVSVCVCF